MSKKCVKCGKPEKNMENAIRDINGNLLCKECLEEEVDLDGD